MDSGDRRRFFFALINFARRATGIDLLERPLLIGLIAGHCTGDWEMVLPMAIFFELYWLDILPMGIIIPPLSSLAFLLTLSIALVFNFLTADYLVLPMAAAILCAHFGAFIEYRGKILANAYLKTLENWSAKGDPGKDASTGVTLRVLVINFASKFCLFSICFASIFGMLRHFENSGAQSPRLPDVNWHILLAISAVGALLALRIKHAYISFFTTAVVLIVYSIL